MEGLDEEAEGGVEYAIKSCWGVPDHASTGPWPLRFSPGWLFGWLFCHFGERALVCDVCSIGYGEVWEEGWGEEIEKLELELICRIFILSW